MGGFLEDIRTGVDVQRSKRTSQGLENDTKKAEV
jgi:hypothetical protein